MSALFLNINYIDDIFDNTDQLLERRCGWKDFLSSKDPIEKSEVRLFHLRGMNLNLGINCPTFLEHETR